MRHPCYGSYGEVPKAIARKLRPAPGRRRDGMAYYSEECPTCHSVCPVILVRPTIFVFVEHENPIEAILHRHPSGFCDQCYPLAKGLLEAKKA